VNFRMRRREEPEIMLIPLIDILLMLLIFFMLATTFKHAAEISINLPEASQQKLPDQNIKMLDVAIDANGRFYLDRQEVVHTELDTVKRAMEKIANGRKDLIVVISADAKTPHQAVITAMDAARQLGLVRITLAAQQPKSAQSNSP
jgi:biopolymer transport protein ExbD